MLIHVVVGNEQMLVDIWRQDLAVKSIFAHADENLCASLIGRIIEQCNQALIEFSARATWCYGGMTGDEDLLISTWRELVFQYPGRFLIRTTPTWKLT